MLRRKILQTVLKHCEIVQQVSNSFNGKMERALGDLNMEDGGIYSLHITAFDGALLATAHESSGVTIDTTQPSEPTVIHSKMFTKYF